MLYTSLLLVLFLSNSDNKSVQSKDCTTLYNVNREIKNLSKIFDVEESIKFDRSMFLMFLM